MKTGAHDSPPLTGAIAYTRAHCGLTPALTVAVALNAFGARILRMSRGS